MKLTENISLQEIVPLNTYNEMGNRAVRKMNSQLILGVQGCIDLQKEFAHDYGVSPWEGIIMNTLYRGGIRDESGLRIPGHEYYRDGGGMHDNGNAIDFIPFVEGYTARELVRSFHNFAVDNPALIFNLGIWRIEVISLAGTWIHMDAQFNTEQLDQGEVVFIDRKYRYTAEEYKDMLNPPQNLIS